MSLSAMRNGQPRPLLHVVAAFCYSRNQCCLVTSQNSLEDTTDYDEVHDEPEQS